MENFENPELKKYMVTISFFIDDNFMNLVPPHRTYINYLINNGVIDSYVVSMESYRTWITLTATSKEEVTGYLQKSPLHHYWSYQVDELFVYDGQTYRLPLLQMN